MTVHTLPNFNAEVYKLAASIDEPLHIRAAAIRCLAESHSPELSAINDDDGIRLVEQARHIVTAQHGAELGRMAQVWEDYHAEAEAARTGRSITRAVLFAAAFAAAAVVAVLTAAGTTAHANAVAQAATMGAY